MKFFRYFFRNSSLFFNFLIMKNLNDVVMVSPVEMLEDLTECVTKASTKVNKRLERLKVVCKCLNISYDTYISQFVVLQDTNVKQSLGSFFEFLYGQYKPKQSGIFKINNNFGESICKRTIESALTAKMNSDLGVYYLTCGIAKDILNRINDHSIFGSLLKKNRLIFVHKGGIAQRLALLHLYPQYESEIKTSFALGGDNDITVIIDPSIDNYDLTRNSLIEYIHNLMKEMASKINVDMVKDRARSFNSINIETSDGAIDIPVHPQNRRDFKIYKNGDMSYMDVYVTCNEVYTSLNEDIEFVDGCKKTCKFSLLRYKQSFRVGNRIIGAELMDISIPHRLESRSSDLFSNYNSGKWLNNVPIDVTNWQ